MSTRREEKRTDYHGGELETFADALAVNLVWEVGKADVAHEFFADGGDGGHVGGGKGGVGGVGVAVVAVGEVLCGEVGVGHLRGKSERETVKITFKVRSIGGRKQLGHSACLCLAASNLGLGRSSLYATVSSTLPSQRAGFTHEYSLLRRSVWRGVGMVMCFMSLPSTYFYPNMCFACGSNNLYTAYTSHL